MSHEVSYTTWTTGMRSSEATEDVADNERWLKSIEQEIFAYICMDPERVRVRRKKKGEDDGPEEEDNARYLSRVWEDLKSGWRETHHNLVVAQQLEDAVKEKTYKVELCPDCFRQVKYGYDKDKHDWVWKCPKCEKVVEKPIVAEVDTINEDD